jgi:hypothetical protein
MAEGVCRLKELTVKEGATVEGGTEAEFLAKETQEPSTPSTTVKLKTNGSSGLKQEAKFVIAAAVKTALEEGQKVSAASIHVNVKSSASAKSLKFGFVAAGVFSEPEVTTSQEWFSVSLSKAQAGALTLKELEELKGRWETILGKALTFFEMYLFVKTEAAAASKAEARLEATGGATAYIKGAGTAHATPAATGGLAAVAYGHGAAKATSAATAGTAAFAKGRGQAHGSSAATGGSSAYAKGSGALTAVSAASSAWKATLLGNGGLRAAVNATSGFLAKALGHGALRAGWEAVSEWFASARQRETVTPPLTAYAASRPLYQAYTGSMPVIHAYSGASQ